MDQVALTAFGDEFSKIAGIGDWWKKFVGLFRSEPKQKPVKSRSELLVDYHFSPKSGKDKWDKFLRNIGDPDFVKAITKNPQADEKLILHAKSMHDLVRGEPVGKVQSSRLPGMSYEIKKTPDGLACTCPDWRFKGSVNPDHECKHIKAHRAGKVRA